MHTVPAMLRTQNTALFFIFTRCPLTNYCFTLHCKCQLGIEVVILWCVFNER